MGDKGQTAAGYLDAAKTVLSPLLPQTRSLQPPHVWNLITPELYFVFWSLSLYDLEVPREAYANTIKRLQETLVWRVRWGSTVKYAHQRLAAQQAELERDAALPKSKLKKERINTEETVKRLEQELVEQERNNDFVLQRLNSEKDVWIVEVSLEEKCCFSARLFFDTTRPSFSPISFTAPRPADRGHHAAAGIMHLSALLLLRTRFVAVFLWRWTWPVAYFFLFSQDAVFCAKFVEMLHRLETKRWITLVYYDRVFKDISFTVTR